MNSKPQPHTRRCFTAVLLFLVVCSALFLVSCKQKTASKPADVDYYTCTMHPSVRAQDPNGKCPICGMDLVPVKKKGSSSAGEPAHGIETAKEQTAGMEGPAGQEETMKEEEPSEFMVAVSRQQQIGVTYAMATNKPLELFIRTVGVVAFDRARHWEIVTRVDGYVDKLFVSSPGELVEKNQPITALYSPDLLTTQREFVDLLSSRDEVVGNASAVSHAHFGTNASTASESLDKLIASARSRLRLWSITDSQIQDLEKTRKPNVNLTFFAPVRGLVQNLEVNQGQKVMSGNRLLTVDDLSVVWVWGEFFQEELPLLRQGQPVSVTSSAFPDRKYSGRIAVIDPFINPSTRVARVRVDIENPGFELRPDMYVDVALSIVAGDGLTVPVSAVLPTGKHNIVFVDKGEGRLEPRFVELGRKYGEDYQIRGGLKTGERVVASANFLIDAEAKVQGALKSF